MPDDGFVAPKEPTDAAVGSDTPGASDSSGPADIATLGSDASTVIEYAPYFYTWGWGSGGYPFTSLTDMKKKGGPAAATIGFVLSGGGCKASRDIQDNLADVKSFIAAGGHLKASFGGASGSYLENACPDAASLAKALTTFVTETGITDLDFDLEHGATSSNAKINALRATALKQVQMQKGIRVAFTLPVEHNGLDSKSLDIVRSAVNAGVQISFVNIMTMDYGGGTDLGTTPIASIEATVKQLQSVISGLTTAAAYRMIGATAMLGHNDDSEVFSLANAQTLVDYAKQKKLGLVSFWAIQRDQKCSGGVDLDRCTGVNSSTFQFHQIFDSVRH
jgi:chitinase